MSCAFRSTSLSTSLPAHRPRFGPLPPTPPNRTRKQALRQSHFLLEQCLTLRMPAVRLRSGESAYESAQSLSSWCALAGSLISGFRAECARLPPPFFPGDLCLWDHVPDPFQAGPVLAESDSGLALRLCQVSARFHRALAVETCPVFVLPLTPSRFVSAQILRKRSHLSVRRLVLFLGCSFTWGNDC